MGSEQKIEFGDEVIVHFSTHPSLRGIVRYSPVATGDSWIILRGDDRAVIYVQQFDYMERV